jgi:hypothetical protein
MRSRRTHEGLSSMNASMFILDVSSSFVLEAFITHLLKESRGLRKSRSFQTPRKTVKERKQEEERWQEKSRTDNRPPRKRCRWRRRYFRDRSASVPPFLAPTLRDHQVIVALPPRGVLSSKCHILDQSFDLETERDLGRRCAELHLCYI